jgi:transcriptional antiterminator RfaH
MTGDSINQNWIVCRTHAMRENYAAENATRQGYEVYLPRMLQRIKVPSPRFVGRPVFPSYLFVRWRQHWGSLLSTFGISYVIRNGDSAGTISDKTIRQLREREDERGFIELPKLEPGMRLAIKSGAFSGQVGLYQGMAPNERQRVLLDILGRKAEVFIASDALELVA